MIAAVGIALVTATLALVDARATGETLLLRNLGTNPLWLVWSSGLVPLGADVLLQLALS